MSWSELVRVYLETPDPSASLICYVSIFTCPAKKDFTLSSPVFHVPGIESRAPIDFIKSSAVRLSLEFIKFFAETISESDLWLAISL